MIFSILYILLAFSVLGLAQDTRLDEVKKAFDAANIPKTIHLPFMPQVLLEVTFTQTTGGSVTLHAGNKLPVNETAIAPIYHIVGSKSKGPFVVVMIDPDAPSAQTPTLAEVRHFLGGNFFLDSSKEPNLLLNSTLAVSDFFRPVPPKGSGLHRYIFLLFSQPKGFDQQTVVPPDSPHKAGFNISSFAEAVGLGYPIGGTFMLVGPDEPSVK